MTTSAVSEPKGEFKQLATLAAPIIITQLSQMGMGVADAIMAGQVGALALAGVTLGGNLYWPVMLFLSGTIMAVTPTVSQLDGAGRRGEAGEVVRQALWIAVTAGIVFTLALSNAEGVYHFVGVDPLAIPLAADYLAAVSTGLVPLLGYFALRYLCEGTSWTLPAMVIGFSAFCLKLPLTYALVFGFEPLGIEAVGAVGCGWATAAVVFYQFIAMLVVVSRPRMKSARLFARFSLPDPQMIVRLLKLGVPIGLSLFVEVAFFSVITLLVGTLGFAAVASHQIASNVTGVTFMIPLAIGMATTIRVGFNVGARSYDNAKATARVAYNFAFGWGVLSAILLFVFRHQIVALYNDDVSVLPVAASLLLLGGLFQVFDCVQVASIASLRGYKDTRVPTVLTLVAYWAIGLPVGAALCFGWFSEPMGVHGFWWGLIVGLGVAAVVLSYRLYRVANDESRIVQFSSR